MAVLAQDVGHGLPDQIPKAFCRIGHRLASDPVYLSYSIVNLLFVWAAASSLRYFVVLLITLHAFKNLIANVQAFGCVACPKCLPEVPPS